MLCTITVVTKSNTIDKLLLGTTVLVTVLVSPSLLEPINLIKLFSLSLGVGVAGLFLLQKLNKTESFKVERFVFIIVACFLSLAFLSSIINEQDLYNSAMGAWGRNNGLISLTAFLLIFLIFSSVKNQFLPKFLLLNLVVLGFFLSIYAWLQHFNLDIISVLFPSYQPPGITLTLGNSNFASAFLGLTFTASIGFALNSINTKSMRLAALFSGFIHIPLIPLLDTQGRIIFAVGGFIVVGVWLSTIPNRVWRKISYGYWAFSTLIGFLGLSGLFGFGIFSERLSDDVTNLKDRYYHWISALNMMKDNMFFGVGIDAFGDYYRRYRTEESIILRGTAMSGTDNAHNSFLQYGATGGVPMLIVYFLLILFIFWRSLKAFKLQSDKRLVGTLFAVWVGYQVQSLVSIEQIGISIWHWVLSGVLVNLSFESKSVTDKAQEKSVNTQKEIKILPKIIMAFFSIGLIFSSLFFVLPSITNDRQINRQLEILNSANSREQIVDSINTLLPLVLSSKQPKLRMTVADTLGRKGFIAEAFKLADQTTKDFPTFLSGWEIAATILEGNNQKSEAVYYRTKTVELDPLNQIFIDKLQDDERASR
jgi:O-antigen ligase